MVVFPAASSPTIRIRLSVGPANYPQLWQGKQPFYTSSNWEKLLILFQLSVLMWKLLLTRTLNLPFGTLVAKIKSDLCGGIIIQVRMELFLSLTQMTKNEWTMNQALAQKMSFSNY